MVVLQFRFPKIQNGHAPHFNSTSDSTSNDTNKTGFQNFSDCSFVNHLEFSAKEKKLRFVDKLPPQNKRSLVNFLMRPKKLEWVLWNGDCNIKPGMWPSDANGFERVVKTLHLRDSERSLLHWHFLSLLSSYFESLFVQGRNHYEVMVYLKPINFCLNSREFFYICCSVVLFDVGIIFLLPHCHLN